MTVLCVLPARIGSERLPRKPLQRIAGRSLLEWSWRAASRAAAFDAVWIATDSEEVALEARRFGARALLTPADLPSGTDRVAAVARLPEAATFDLLVNCQADEPFLPPGSVEPAILAVRSGRAPIATLATAVRSAEEWHSESVVKVVRARDGRALYFSRAPVPHTRGGPGAGAAAVDGLRHVGVYVFTRAALERWAALPVSPLESVERLEQLRVVEAGIPIHVVLVPAVEPGVDEPADLARAERRLGPAGAPDPPAPSAPAGSPAPRGARGTRRESPGRGRSPSAGGGGT